MALIPSLLVALSHLNFAGDEYLRRILISNIFSTHFEGFLACPACEKDPHATVATIVPVPTTNDLDLLSARARLFAKALVSDKCNPKLLDFVFKSIMTRYFDRQSSARGRFSRLLKLALGFLQQVVELVLAQDEARFVSAISFIAFQLTELLSHASISSRADVFNCISGILKSYSQHVWTRSASVIYSPLVLAASSGAFWNDFLDGIALFSLRELKLLSRIPFDRIKSRLGFDIEEQLALSQMALRKSSNFGTQHCLRRCRLSWFIFRSVLPNSR